MLVALDGSTAYIFGYQIPAYPLLVGLACATTGLLILALYMGRWSPQRVATMVLAMAAAALLGGRLEYVLYNANYFAAEFDQVFNIASGGLEPRLALAAAVAVGQAWTRRTGRPSMPLFTALAIGVPLIAFGAWWGCAAAACGYGAEVDNLSNYPSWLVWESAGEFLMVAPRYAVQSLGMLSAAAALLAVLGMRRSGVRGRSLMAVSAMLCFASIAVLSGLRGDPAPMWLGVRVDQWADIAVCTLCVAILIANRRSRIRAA